MNSPFLNKILLTSVLPLLAMQVSATPAKGSNCAGCHTAARTGMALVNFQTTTNLGSGVLKVYTVKPGDTLPIKFNATNDYGGNYSITLNNLAGGGYYNTANHLAFTADNTWTSQSSGGYFTTAVGSTTPKTWTFNLLVKSTTPPDIYSVQTQIAGVAGSKWAQKEQFYIQVLSAAPPAPTIVAPQYTGGTFALQVSTVATVTYYLERTGNPAATSWSVVAQVSGDGTVKSLSDPTPPAGFAFYRVRAQ